MKIQHLSVCREENLDLFAKWILGRGHINPSDIGVSWTCFGQHWRQKPLSREMWVSYLPLLVVGASLLFQSFLNSNRSLDFAGKTSKCKCGNGDWSSIEEKKEKRKPFERALQPLQQSKENLLSFKSHTQKGRGPTFTEYQLSKWLLHWGAEGTDISVLRNNL